MRWKQILLYGLGGTVAAVLVLGWMAVEGMLDPVSPPPRLTIEQRRALHPETLVALDAYLAKDYERALKLWKQRAEMADTEAQFRIGRLYDLGEGVAISYQTARKWYLLAAKKKHPIATYNLAVQHWHGRDVPEDRERASQLIHEAAILGSTKAQGTLGSMYLNGQHVREDHEEAVRWLEMSVRQGDRASQGLLSVLFLLGNGLVEDRIKAYELHILGGRNNSWRYYLTEPFFYFKTTSQERKEAKRRADAWLRIYQKRFR
jgi:TPR repeat protein